MRSLNLFEEVAAWWQMGKPDGQKAPLCLDLLLLFLISFFIKNGFETVWK